MERAYLIDENGKSHEIHAYDANKRNKYFCPTCHKPVELRSGEYIAPYFAHKKGMGGEECPFYQSKPINTKENLTIEFYRKKTGFPLYLEQIGEHFQFYLDIEDIRKKNVKIEKTHKIQILGGKPERKIAETPISEPCVYLNVICQEYKIQYQLNGNTAYCYEITPGFYNYGTFFHSRGAVHRKVSYFGKIWIGIEYYLATREENIGQYSFLEVSQRKYKLMTNNQNYTIYTVKFLEITRESREFADKCNVQLDERSEEYLPIWPPIQQYSSANKTVHITTKYTPIYGKILKKSTQHPKSSFVYDELLPEKERCYPLQDDGEKSTTIEYKKNYGVYPPYQKPKVSLQYNDTPIQLNETSTLHLTKRKISIHSDIPCHIILRKGEIPYSSYKNILEIYLFDEIQKNAELLVYHGHKILGVVSFVDEKCKCRLKDENLYFHNSHLDKKMIKTPVFLKYLGPKLSQTPINREQIRLAIKQGLIPKIDIHTISKKLKRKGVNE